jgi:hypothetical protein
MVRAFGIPRLGSMPVDRSRVARVQGQSAAAMFCFSNRRSGWATRIEKLTPWNAHRPSARYDFGAYWIYSAVTRRPTHPPLPLVHSGTGPAALEFYRVFQRLEKGRPGERSRSVGWTGLKGMTASGPRTASPQVSSEVVLATNSACPFSLEALIVSPIVFFISRIASFLDAFRPQSVSSLHPSADSASRPRILSVPSVRRA